METLTISALSRLVGVPPETIRSWERRYRLPIGRRSAGGHRRYTATDTEILRRMRDEVAAGRTAAKAAEVVKAALSTPTSWFLNAVLLAAHRLDDRAVVGLLDAARDAHGLVSTVEDVLLPALREIGAQWADGRCDVSHEHLLTAALDRWLSQEELAAPPPSRPGRVLLACGPVDLHAVGLHAFAVLLGRRGVDVLTLGARTPADALCRAAGIADVRAVVVVSQLESGRTAAAAALRAVTAAVPAVRVYFAGAAFEATVSRAGLPGTYLGPDLNRAAGQVAEAIGPGPRDRRP